MKKLKSLSESYIDNICGKNYPFGKNIKEFLNKIPDIDLTLEIEEEKLYLTLNSKSINTICNGHLIIFNEKKNIFIMRFINLKNENSVSINVSVKKNESLPIFIYFITEKFIGFDKSYSVDKNFILAEKNIDDEHIGEEMEDVSVAKKDENNKQKCDPDELDSQQLKLLDQVIAEELAVDPNMIDKKIKNKQKNKTKNANFDINKEKHSKNNINQNSKNYAEKRQDSLNNYFEKRKASSNNNTSKISGQQNDKPTENMKLGEDNKALIFNNFNLFIDNLVFDDDIKEKKKKSPVKKRTDGIVQKTELTELNSINHNEKSETNQSNLIEESTVMSNLSKNGGKNDKLTDFYSFFADLF